MDGMAVLRLRAAPQLLLQVKPADSIQGTLGCLCGFPRGYLGGLLQAALRGCPCQSLLELSLDSGIALRQLSRLHRFEDTLELSLPKAALTDSGTYPRRSCRPGTAL